MKERFLINPWKRATKKGKKKGVKKMAKNPTKGKKMSAATKAKIAAGVRAANARKVKVSRASVKKVTKRKKHTVTAYGSGKTWTRSPLSTSKRQGIAINRPKRRKKYKKNPPLNKIQKLLPIMGTGAVSVILTTMAPGVVPQAATNPLLRYGIMGAVAVGGGMAADKMLGKQHGTTFVAVGGAVILADLVKTYILAKILPGLSDYELEDYELEDYELEAFPDEDLGAFPTELEDYDMMEGPYEEEESAFF